MGLYIYILRNVLWEHGNCGLYILRNVLWEHGNCGLYIHTKERSLGTWELWVIYILRNVLWEHGNSFRT